MADLGMNIVTVIHQPRYSVFSLFHEVLLLGKAGRTVFQGASTSALPYFICLGFQLPANENPADFFLDIVSGCVTCHANPDFQTEVLLLPVPAVVPILEFPEGVPYVRLNLVIRLCTAAEEAL